ncbi:MAG: DHH family phosphoesterase, partial [Clostridia bacterium]
MNKRFIRMLEPRFRLCFVMLVLFALSSFFVSPWLAVAELAVVLIVYLQFRRSTLKRSREVAKFVEAMMYNVDVATKDSLINFPLPMAILKLESNEIIWYNDEFTKMTGSHERVFETHLRDVMPKLDLHWLIEGKRECPAMFGFGGKNYRILGNIVRPSDDGSKAGLLATLYWIDNTELVDMRHTFAKTRQIAAILMIDNFEEIMNGVADSGRNAILAAIDEKIAKWTEDVGGILLKSERDRYIFIFEERYLEKYREEKFNLLDAVREVESSNGIRPTLSIGVGKDGSSYLDNYKSAELAIEMSLSRGGDQAIIRNKFNFEFFGGHSAELEKRTKVKSRVMSNALAELIKDAS